MALTTEDYYTAGQEAALAMKNRGPIRFTDDGQLHPDILDAYWEHGFYVFENVVRASELAELQADLLVVCDYGQILKPPALAAARLGGINLHGSLLPKYRGAAPVHWAIWNGDPTTGITVIHMTPKLDGGPSLARAASNSKFTP